jgi:hypothetical protein
VENNTGVTIPKGKVVRLNGMGAIYPQVLVGNPTIDSNFGVVGNDISAVATQNFGLVTCLGFMFNMNTAAWPVDTLLFSDTSGNLSSVSLGPPVARVIAQDATFGILYAFPAAALANEGDIAWLTTGNTILPGDFIGTSNAEDLRFRTAGTQKMVLDQFGRLGIGEANPTHQLELKTHSNANASGIQEDTWYVETNSTGYSTATVIMLADPSLVRVEVTANCREATGLAFASFRRSGLFYRQSSNVQVQGASWQSDFTQKSNSNINVQYVLGVNSITVQVQPSSGATHRWSGMVRLQQLF